MKRETIDLLVVAEVIKKAKLTTDDFQRVLDRRGGLAALRRHLRPGECQSATKAASIFTPTGTIFTTPELPESEVDDFLTTGTHDGIKVWTSDDFRSDFSGMVLPAIPGANLHLFSLNKKADGNAMSNAAGGNKGLVSLSQITHLILSNQLEKDGRWYLFLVENRNGVTRVVLCRWDSVNSRWGFCVLSLSLQWNAGYRLVSAIPLPAV